MQPVS